MTRRDESPPGEVPNYAGRMLWAIWSLTVGSAVFLALRVYCKLTRHRSLWWDDHFLIARLPSWFQRRCSPKVSSTASACITRIWTH
ncbi:hypothetical protein VTI74DRAFT_8351 [Chaetomium olivicolor]